jgi:hypothetical protein
MAYSLSDRLRPLRIALRINGALVGLAPGLAMLLLSKATLSHWGLYVSGPVWPLRVAGAALIGLGLVFVLAANQETIGLSTLVTSSVVNLLLALILLIAYFQQEFAGLNALGQLLLVLIFALCLAGVLAPLPYLRAEYRY